MELGHNKAISSLFVEVYLLCSACGLQVGDGQHIQLWKEVWLGLVPLGG